MWFGLWHENGKDDKPKCGYTCQCEEGSSVTNVDNDVPGQCGAQRGTETLRCSHGTLGDVEVTCPAGQVAHNYGEQRAIDAAQIGVGISNSWT